MSTVKANNYYDASGGSNAQLYGVASPPNSMGFRNRILNGSMVIDQRNAGASVTPVDAYVLDRWEVREDTDGAISVQQVSDAPAGFSFSQRVTTTTADASLTGTQRLLVAQPIEGFNTADLAFGTASAQTVTVSFWVKSSLTGTFSGSLQNAARSRSYVFNYSISSANTWEYKTVTIAGDTTGTWIGATNGVGLRLSFALGIGPDYTGTANSWQGSQLFASSGSVSVIGTLNATWQITGVQLEAGTVASPFERRDYGRELIMCQRYCFVPASSSRYVGQCDATTRALMIYVFPQSMRTGPSATLASAATYNVTTATGGTVAGTAVSLSGGYVDTAQVAITVASGLVAGNATLVTANGTTIFSAEL